MEYNYNSFDFEEEYSTSYCDFDYTLKIPKKEKVTKYKKLKKILLFIITLGFLK